MERLKVGLIGCGQIGSYLAQVCEKVERIELAAVADILPEAARALGEKLGVAHYADDGRRMLRRADIAGVIIATPPYAHRKGVERAARSGKHIFCEKPMATNVSDCDAMIAAVEKAGVKLQMGQVLRYLPLQARTLELVRSGTYGEPFAVSVTRISGLGFGEWWRPWRGSHRDSGGILMEINSHEFDFMRQLCGDAAVVFARAGRYLNSAMRTPDQLFVIVEFANGAMGELHASVAASIGEYEWKVLCREGGISCVSAPGRSPTLLHGKHGSEPFSETPATLDPGDAFARELREWAQAVLDDKPVTIPGIDSRRAVELAEAAYKSALSGKLVRLPLARATGAMAREWYESDSVAGDPRGTRKCRGVADEWRPVSGQRSVGGAGDAA